MGCHRQKSRQRLVSLIGAGKFQPGQSATVAWRHESFDDGPRETELIQQLSDTCVVDGWHR
jgi:hypothetical protein